MAEEGKSKVLALIEKVWRYAVADPTELLLEASGNDGRKTQSHLSRLGYNCFCIDALSRAYRVVDMPASVVECQAWEWGRVLPRTLERGNTGITRFYAYVYEFFGTQR
jgi:hypothetical protein